MLIYSCLYIHAYIFMLCAGVFEFVHTVGERMVFRDQYIPFALFSDFGLPKLCTLFRSQPRKLPLLVKLLYSFALPHAEEHAKVVRKLQETLDDLALFIKCLCVLVTLEKEFDEVLIDLYVYYAGLGLKNSSPSLRAASLSIFSIVLPHDNELKFVFNVLESMMDAVNDDWWEVQVQLLECASSILKVVGEDHPHSNMVYGLFERLLNPNMPIAVQKIGLSAMSSCLASHPVLLRHFVDVLLTSDPVRTNLLGPPQPEEIMLSSSVRGMYHLEFLPSVWYGLGIVQSIALQVREGSLENLGTPRVELLAAAICNIPEFPPDELDLWRVAFEELKEHILVELCDERSCHHVVSILKKFLLDPSLSQDALKIMMPTVEGKVPPLFGILRLIFPDGAEICQNAVYEMLTSLVFTRGSGHFVTHIHALLKNFALRETKKFTSSHQLRALLTLVEEARS
eukprot:TRINITY_DN22724_c0_g1_i3.p1 TRINITY_DN22724_c0_g1~~TRINITY_DN22724_c0_g1_i3.p1  ORF type:complete len:454 (+),score=36.56 TRINITY_DN22724_c0_g1_i3:90-1451(+)